jgi:death on curing protein
MEAEPIWIEPSVVEEIHRRQLAQHGGQEGIRDRGMLESALGRPRNLWGYSNPRPDFAQLAASYAFGIARNHPFIDGNKRTAFVVCRLFLKRNGHELIASEAEKYATFLALAAGELSEEQLVNWLCKRIQPAE